MAASYGPDLCPGRDLWHGPTMPTPERGPKPKLPEYETPWDGLKVGDHVAYSVTFLRSIGTYTGDMPHAKGEVTGLVPLGETTLAEVAWDRAELPARVNVNNLCRVGSRAFHD